MSQLSTGIQVMLALLDSSVLEVTNYKKGTPMSKHMAKRRKKAVKHGHAARPLKRAPGKKPTRAKKPVARRGQVLGQAAGELQALEPDVAGVVEVFEVEVVSDAEETR